MAKEEIANFYERMLLFEPFRLLKSKLYFASLFFT